MELETSNGKYTEEHAREESSQIQKTIEELSVEPDNNYRNQEKELYRTAEKLAEAKASIIAIARIETRGATKEFGKYFYDLPKQKIDALKEDEIEIKCCGGFHEPGYLKYKGETISNPDNFFLEDYELNPQKHHEYALSEYNKFRHDFRKFPGEIREKIIEFYNWYYDKKVTGRTFDACYKAGLISRDRYTIIKQAEEKGKIILWGGLSTRHLEPKPSDIGYDLLPYRGRVYFWALSEPISEETSSKNTTLRISG